MLKILCPYCGEQAKLTKGTTVHSQNYGPVWLCEPCKAWVGTHKGRDGHEPLGTLANAELRLWRRRAHGSFDRLWEGKMRRDRCSRSKARSAGYEWLAGQLGIRGKFCHIGHMDLAECKRVVEVCSAVGQKKRSEEG